VLTANLVQSAFRFRNDDGSETTATWKAALNTNVTQAVDEVFRLRLARTETAGGALNNTSHALEYSLNSGAWTAVGSTTPVQFTTSANVADNTATTQQITSGTFSTDPSEVDSDGAVSNAPSWDGNDDVEYEAVLTIDSAQVANDDTIAIRHAGLNGYSFTPTLTVVEAAVDALTANGITSAPDVGTSTIAQTHGLTATGIASAPDVGTATILFTPGDTWVVGSTTGGSPITWQVGTTYGEIGDALTANGIASAPDVGTSTLGQTHGLTA